MKRTAFVALLLLLCPVWAISGQQSQGEWEPFKELKEQKRQEVAAQSITNSDIMKFVKIGFSDETIISVVNNQPGEYSLGADDIIALKTAGVSEKVIAAMLKKTPSSPTPAPKPPEGVPDKQDRSGQSFSQGSLPPTDPNAPVPKEHGLYYQASNRLVPIEGQVVSFTRSGSLLSSAVTLGIKSAKGNVQILGPTSAHTTASRPVFYYRVAEATEAAGGSAGDLVLVRMSVKHNRRQFEVAASGAWRASRGISIRSQLQVARKRIEADLYRLTPSEELKQGEYGLFLFRGYDLPGFVYDFSVE